MLAGFCVPFRWMITRGTFLFSLVGIESPWALDREVSRIAASTKISSAAKEYTSLYVKSSLRVASSMYPLETPRICLAMSARSRIVMISQKRPSSPQIRRWRSVRRCDRAVAEGWLTKAQRGTRYTKTAARRSASARYWSWIKMIWKMI